MAVTMACWGRSSSSSAGISSGFMWLAPCLRITCRRTASTSFAGSTPRGTALHARKAGKTFVNRLANSSACRSRPFPPCRRTGGDGIPSRHRKGRLPEHLPQRMHLSTLTPLVRRICSLSNLLIRSCSSLSVLHAQGLGQQLGEVNDRQAMLSGAFLRQVVQAQRDMR